ncbi:Transcription initiation factor TFIID subunit 10 [Haplosporangium sp. Z 767]|nr:Transcription initiation factor TFIID subunit 10 [Haplosporangium sp. Z 11]KAF9183831.1 Transcription initiation factor TFIID subunit 10 [Haplosporangium sp. Z 767]
MSDSSNSSHSTIEDITMSSPHSAGTPAAPMDQDTPSSSQGTPQASSSSNPGGEGTPITMTTTSASAPTTTAATTITTITTNNTTPATSAPSTLSAPASTQVQPFQTSSQASQQDMQRQQQQLQQQQYLQKQAQLAQFQQAQAAAAGTSAAASVAQHNLAVGAALQSRKEEELNRKDRTLAEFLPMMETYNPIIPDAVTDYYLSRTGFDCDDIRIKRLLALAAQKFVSDIATDAFQYCKVRQQSQKRVPGKEKKTVLTMEDLSDALGEYGINVKKPDYFM